MSNNFEQPTKLSPAEIAFPARVSDLMPAYEDIPDEFKKGSNPYVKFQQKWFFSGLDKFPEAQDGIYQDDAARHLAAIQGSFEPKHEHKEAGVAYLASKWLKLE